MLKCDFCSNKAVLIIGYKYCSACVERSKTDTSIPRPCFNGDKIAVVQGKKERRFEIIDAPQHVNDSLSLISLMSYGKLRHSIYSDHDLPEGIFDYRERFQDGR